MYIYHDVSAASHTLSHIQHQLTPLKKSINLHFIKIPLINNSPKFEISDRHNEKQENKIKSKIAYKLKTINTWETRIKSYNHKKQSK